MSNILFPGNNWVFKYGAYEGNQPQTDSDGHIVASISNEDTVTFTSDFMATGYEVWVFYVNSNGVVVSDENRILALFKSTSTPTFFDTYEVYLEDCNGLKATYKINNQDVGKDIKILKTALVEESGFNESYIVKIGFHFKNPTSAGRMFVFSLSSFEFSSSANPTYAQPQEIIDFLGIVDNKGNPFKITDSTTPSYAMVASRIVEAENYVEERCRRAWVERRIEQPEIRNADSAWPGFYGYMGIYAGTGPEQGAQMFYKGVPIKLSRDYIQPIDYSRGDLVEVRRYGSYWSAVDQQAIWEDTTKGIIYVKSLFFQKDSSVRVTYRYGYGPVPPAIKRAVILKTAMLIVQTDSFFRQKFPTMGETPSTDPAKASVITSWSFELNDLLRPFANYVSVGGI